MAILKPNNILSNSNALNQSQATLAEDLPAAHQKEFDSSPADHSGYESSAVVLNTQEKENTEQTTPLPQSPQIPTRKESLENIVTSPTTAAAKDDLSPVDAATSPTSPTDPVYRKPTKTPPRKSVYNVWEQNDADGVIVQERVEVNIPTMSRRRITSLPLSPSGRFGDGIQVPIGTPVREGHANYLLMYDMLTGIRVSVSRCHAKPNRVLENSDFTAAHKLAFDVTGNELLPKASYDFKFKDYAPWIFRNIRDVFRVDAPEYLLSLTGKYVLSELGSPGKSRSFFYFSQDYRFIIKTISKTEHKFFRRILRGYYEHVKENPDTLITRIMGLHRVKIPGGQKIRFVVMGNVFPANKDIHETYDLKGSMVGRYVKPEDIKPHSTLKDINFINNEKKIYLGPHKRGMFLEQLEKDTLFLQMMNVMDYSLLLGVHNLEKGNRENIRDTTLSAFEPTAETLVRRQPTNPTVKGSRSRSTSRHRRTASEAIVEPSRAILPDDSPPEREHFRFYNEMGGLQGCDSDGVEVDEVYYLGVIDIFTEYNSAKKVEHFFKSLLGNGKMISAVNSNAYGRRFVAFIEKCCQ